jgi:hypothetical protein
MQRSTILVLKTLIVALVAMLLFCQIAVVPQVAAQSALRYPEIDYLAIPGTIVGVAFLVCVQAVLICVWRLLSLVRRESIFSERAFPDVDTSLAAVAFATILVLVTLIVLASTGHATASIVLLCLLGVVVGVGLCLLIVVMRGLLKKAWRLEQDLSEVV